MAMPMGILALLEILFIFVLPIVLLYFNIIAKKLRLAVLAVAVLVVLIIVVIDGMTLETLGLHRINGIKGDLVPYAIFTVVALIVILFISLVLRRKPQAGWCRDAHFWFLFIPISLGQEFLYRGFLFPKLALVWNNAVFIILANTLLFALLHVIYQNKKVNIPFALIAGLAFASWYYYIPNLIFISVAHALLNFVAVLFGFFTDERDPRLIIS